MNPNFTGGNVCNSKTVNFEVVMSCTQTSKITLTNTNGFSKTNTESIAPFSAMGDDSGFFRGQKLTNGAYTLTIYPDQIVTDMVKAILFNVISC